MRSWPSRSATLSATNWFHRRLFNALFETSFFHSKVEDFVGGYTNELLRQVYPSFLDALPSQARAPILDTISALQYRLAEYIAAMLKSEETAEAITAFVDRQIDELLARRVGDTLTRISSIRSSNLSSSALTVWSMKRASKRRSRTLFPGAWTIWRTAMRRWLKRLLRRPSPSSRSASTSQVPPIVHHLADIATSQNTRKQIGALIKREVDDYYEQLSLIKKIFISRERIHREVDELVNKTLPKRIEEYLRGPAFEQEAEAFLNSTIDNVLARPLNELVGQIESEKFDSIKQQITRRIVELARSEELIGFGV